MLDTATTLTSLLNDPSLLETRSYIGGQWVDGDKGTYDVINPARGDVVAEVADLSRAQVAGAIAQAEVAQKEWAKWSGKERSAVLRKWFDLMMAHQDDLGAILTAEQGKPLAEAKGEIAYGASFVEFFGEEAKRIYGETDPRPSARQADHSDKTTHRGCRVHHAVEFPQCDDHPQGSASFGGRVCIHRAPC